MALSIPAPTVPVSIEFVCKLCIGSNLQLSVVLKDSTLQSHIAIVLCRYNRSCGTWQVDPS